MKGKEKKKEKKKKPMTMTKMEEGKPTMKAVKKIGQQLLKKKTKTAGQLQNQVSKDTTKYDAREVGHAMMDDIQLNLRLCIDNHKNIIMEPEFCVVMVIAEDPLLKNLKRRKFYAWPYLPSPRPNQSVFLYNKSADDLTKRLWVLPSAMVMAELSSLSYVDKRYQTMQAWSIAFMNGTFWEYIRYEHSIDMLSEREYFLANRQKLIDAGCKQVPVDFTDPFDFSKIYVPVDKIENTNQLILNQNALQIRRET